MRRVSYFFIFICVFWISASYGQADDPQDDPYIKQQVNKIVPPSPNASSLGIYGNIPVGHYTGVPNISIPIYEIKSGDFTLPIALSYHASGIKVAQEASSVGLGWVLNAGGCIVRKIKHWDDFAYGGYYSDQSFPESDENNDVVDFRDSQYLEYLNNNKDSEPDMFSYNFGNMSGSFFFERYKDSDTNTSSKAEAIISNKDTWLKIVCTKFYEDGYGYATNFEIADAYGNTYLFGSSSALHENTRTFVSTLKAPPEERHLIRYYQDFSPREEKEYEVTTAWYLDKIITAKRDTIKFEYEKEKIYSTISVNEDVSYMFAAWGSIGDGPKNAYKYYNLSYTENDQLLLKKISFNGGVVNIDYANREDVDHTENGKKAKKVDWLTVKNKSNNYVVRARFNHSYMGNIITAITLADKELNALNCRLLLDGISLYRDDGYKAQNYNFSYNNNPLPQKNSKHTDYWGYYNEGPEPVGNQSFHYTPPVRFNYYDSEGHEQSSICNGVNKNSSIDRSQYGILTSIQYPTGGRTDFEYELNEFGNTFFDSLDSLVKIGGGLRIKNIYDLSNTADTTSVRTFTYKKNGVSSGILMTIPVYYLSFILNPKPINPSYAGLFLNGNSNSYSPIMGAASGMYVGYSYVEEKNMTHGTNNGYIAYSFDNTANRIIHIEQLIRNYPSIPSMTNGLPVEITYFDSSNNRVKKTSFSYKQVEQKKIKGLMCYRLPMVEKGDAKFYDLYSERWVLDRKIETRYFPGDKSISLRTAYDYNDTNLLKKYEKISLIGGDEDDTIETYIKYPSDYGSALSGMVNNNMIGIPVEITRKKNGSVVSGNKTSFRQFGFGVYLPEVYSELDTSSGTYYTQYTINRYDSRGNILQLLEKDNIPTSYLWSYNGEYPVAEIKNATYSQVVNALGASVVAAINNYNGSSFSPVPDFQAYGAILRSKLPNALISVYTYKPLVGGTGITDPSGRTTRYGYDSFNRLSEIRDDKGKNGNLMQKFEYKMTSNN